MPVSPTDLNRNKPTLANILKLIDKALTVSNKTTQSSALYLVVDAPFGYYEYRDAIVAAYIAVGWAKVDYANGKSQLQDKILFYPTTLPATTVEEPQNPTLDYGH